MHMDDVMRRKISTAHNKFQDIFQMAKTSEESMDTLIHNLESLSLLIQPASRTRQQEQESFIGMSIPENVQVHPPSDIRSKGKCKRILGHAHRRGNTREYKNNQSSSPRKCTTCSDVGHDRHNCPKKDAAAP
jgi:hypothetical protein